MKQTPFWGIIISTGNPGTSKHSPYTLWIKKDTHTEKINDSLSSQHNICLVRLTWFGPFWCSPKHTMTPDISKRFRKSLKKLAHSHSCAVSSISNPFKKSLKKPTESSDSSLKSIQSPPKNLSTSSKNFVSSYWLFIRAGSSRSGPVVGSRKGVNHAFTFLIPFPTPCRHHGAHGLPKQRTYLWLN